jgi:hypothetical protein
VRNDLKGLLLVGLLFAPTSVLAASVPSTKKPAPAVVKPKADAPRPLTQAEMDGVKGKFFPLVAGPFVAKAAVDAAIVAMGAAAAYNLGKRVSLNPDAWDDESNWEKGQANGRKNNEARGFTAGMSPEKREEFHNLKDGADGKNRDKKQLREDAERVKSGK